MILSDGFNRAVKVVLNHEGGYTNDESDPGGETHFGITFNYLKTVNPVFLKKIGLNKDDANVIKNLTKEQAIHLYQHGYWDKYHYEKIHSIYVAIKIMDMAVNLGALRAHLLLQSGINAIGKHHLLCDGILGKKTLEAVNNTNEHLLINALRRLQALHYKKLIFKNPKLEKFKKGWLARAQF